MPKPWVRPQLEQMETRLVPSVVHLRAGDNLQAAINYAQPGDQLVLDAGATFTGPITLPYKAADQWITILSSALDRLPAGQRVAPQDAALMPKITSPGLGAPALQTAAGAHHFRFVGIEFEPATRRALIYDLITLGNGAQTSLNQVPHDLKLDQCYVHAWLDQSLKRGIALNSAATDIVNSYIAGFKVDGQDSQAVAGWNGPGPFRIENNYLEAAGENVLFGGAPGAFVNIPNLVPSDITIKNNLFTKPQAWNKHDSTTYAGQHWTVKNLLEFKNAERVLVDGNRFENCWVDGQAGTAILLTPLSDAGNPWVVVRDIAFQNNIVVHSAQGIAILGSAPSYSGPTQQTQNITIYNNFFDDIGSARLADPGNVLRLFQLTAGETGGARNVTIDHNTATSGEVVLFAEGTHPGFVFTNNAAPHGAYGVFAYGLEGTAALEKAFPRYTFQGNIIIGADPKRYPPGNFYGTTPDERFVMQIYLDLLHRPVDPTGMAAWTAALAQGAPRAQVAQAIESGSEFRTVEVSDLYTSFLHRTADLSGLKTFTDFLARGGSVEQVAEILTGSQEYFWTQGHGTNDGFLDALYRDALNREVDASGRATFDLALAQVSTPVQVAAAVFTSMEFRQKLVGSFYQRFLHRDADNGGLLSFVGFLGRGSRDEEVIAGIVGSAEYSARV